MTHPYLLQIPLDTSLINLVYQIINTALKNSSSDGDIKVHMYL